MRAAARKHDLPVGGFLILMHDFAGLKSYSAMAHGSQFLHYWRYGPAYANYLPYSWSHNRRQTRGVGTVGRDIARIGDLLLDGTREPAQVALLYAKTDPLWGRGQTENRLVFFALLHDQIPVDLVTEAEVEEDELLDHYTHLYITDRSVRRKTLETAAAWVREGGHLWLSGGAATRDEFDEPCTVLTDALGMAVGDGEIDRQLPTDGGPIDVPAPFAISAPDGEAAVRFEDGAPAQLRGEAVLGRYCVCAMRPGVLYEKPIRVRHNRSRGKAQIQTGWEASRRNWITRFGLDTGVERPVRVDRPAVETALFRHPASDLVLLINYTGEYPAEPMKVQVTTPGEVSRVESLRQGDLDFRQERDHVFFKLPLDRIDSVLLYHR
jgi:hypothetical protein